MHNFDLPLEDVVQRLRDLGLLQDTRVRTPQPSLQSLDHISAPRDGCLTFYSGDDPNAVCDLGACTLICKPALAGANSLSTLLLCDDPHLAFFQAAQLFFPKDVGGSIDAAARIHPEAVIHPSAQIGPYSVIGRCQIGARCRIGPHVVVYDDSVIEEDVKIEAHSCIGATGVYWAWTPSGKQISLPQLGSTRIKRGTFIGTDVTIVRGAFGNEETTIGEECNLSHGSKVGHSCVLGTRTHLANNIALSGNVVIGSECFLGSGAIVRPGTRVADKTVVGAGAVVVKSISEEGLTLVGVPAKAIPTETRSRGVPQRPLADL